MYYTIDYIVVSNITGTCSKKFVHSTQMHSEKLCKRTLKF